MKKFLYAVLSILAMTFAFNANAGYEKFSRAKLSPEARCLADMAYWEARGEGSRGIKAVVDVMFNRIKSKEFPNTICGNFNMRNQYESRHLIARKVDPLLYFYVAQLTERERAKFHLGEWHSSVSNATFFNSHGRAATRRVKKIGKIGRHYFYSIKVSKSRKR